VFPATINSRIAAAAAAAASGEERPKNSADGGDQSLRSGGDQIRFYPD